MFVICKGVLVAGIPPGGVVKFPDVSTIQNTLKRWREDRGLSKAEVVRQGQKLSRNSFEPAEVTRWEQGKTNFTYKRLVEDICPAYGITDIDIFLDFSYRPTISDVVCVRAKDRSVHNGLFGQCLLVAPDFLKNNRTRVDFLELPPNTITPWDHHQGHEYVYLITGKKVWCEFSEDREKKINFKRFELNPKDGIAFPSAIFHCFGNAGTRPAQLFVARPTRSLPQGSKPSRTA